MDYPKQREVAKRQMGVIERCVESALTNNPDLRNIGNDVSGTPQINKLIRHIWAQYRDYNARSITRFFNEVMKRHPEWDTEHNILNRANAETAFHEKFREKAAPQLFNTTNQDSYGE